MRLRASGLIILAVTLIGCASNSKPKTLPDGTGVLDYLLVEGCTGEKVKDVSGPLKDYREKMRDYYGRFMDSKGYKGEKKILDQCNSVEAIDRYFAQFWGVIRDQDRSTPVNEYREVIDQRIRDIENEVLFHDKFAPGTLFRNSGGLRGDMAHVYMFRGDPHYKVTLKGRLLADLMAWVYFDPNQRPLFVFLFYDKGSGYRLFRSHIMIDSLDAYAVALKEIAKGYPHSAEDFINLERELVMNDQEGVFRFAISRFSFYSEIRLDKVLSAPTPELITAKAIQPTILGVPIIPKDLKIAFSPHSATVPGYFRLGKDVSGNFKPSLILKHSDLDWEVKDDAWSTSFDIHVQAINEKTRNKTSYNNNLTFTVKKDNGDEYFYVDLDNLPDTSGKTIPDMLKSLEPGDYEIRVSFFNRRTFKSGMWFEYIAIQ